MLLGLHIIFVLVLYQFQYLGMYFYDGFFYTERDMKSPFYGVLRKAQVI